MKKLLKALAICTALLFFVSTVNAAVTLRYYNKDSKQHTMTVKMSGSTKKVTFESSRTASVTIQGSSTKCTIVTSHGSVEVEDGDNIEIKDGKITVK